MASNTKSDVKDLSLAEKGKKRIEWASRSMPVSGVDSQAVC